MPRPFHLSAYRHSPHRILATDEYSLGFKRTLATISWIFPERNRNSYSETRTLSHLYGNRDILKHVHRTLAPLPSFRKVLSLNFADASDNLRVLCNADTRYNARYRPETSFPVLSASHPIKPLSSYFSLTQPTKLIKRHCVSDVRKEQILTKTDLVINPFLLKIK